MAVDATVVDVLRGIAWRVLGCATTHGAKCAPGGVKEVGVNFGCDSFGFDLRRERTR